MGRPGRWGHVGSRRPLWPSRRGLHSEPGLAPRLPAAVCSEGPHLTGGVQTAEGPRRGRVQARRPEGRCPQCWLCTPTSQSLPSRLGLRAAERGPSRPRHRTHGHGPSAGSTPSFCPQHAPPFLFIVKIRSLKKIGTGQKTVKKETTVPFALSASASRRTRPRRCLRRGACGARSPSFPRGGGTPRAFRSLSFG